MVFRHVRSFWALEPVALKMASECSRQPSCLWLLVCPPGGLSGRALRDIVILHVWLS